MNADFASLLGASAADRRDVFLTAARRLGTTEQNIEKDFWVCWVLDVLFNGPLAAGGPRLLFKGGTSLSKAFGLIERFSEDIDVTVFRDDLGQAASVQDLEALSGKQRCRRLDAIRDTCGEYVRGPMRAVVAEAAQAWADPAPPQVRVEIDAADRDGQTLLFWYPSVTAPAEDAYVRPVVRIESGAKSALDPHAAATVRPYVDQDLDGFDLAVPNITTIEPVRTFWDKAVIAHGLRRWFERRGELRLEGQRISRHYYDLHALFRSEVGLAAVRDRVLAVDCARHARLFFNRPDYDLDSAVGGLWVIAPTPTMLDPLRRDYDAMAGMIFGTVPDFADVTASAPDRIARERGWDPATAMSPGLPRDRISVKNRRDAVERESR